MSSTSHVAPVQPRQGVLITFTYRTEGDSRRTKSHYLLAGNDYISSNPCFLCTFALISGKNMQITQNEMILKNHLVLCYPWCPATSYSRRGKPPTTIGAEELNFRVRDGNGCDLFAIVTRLFVVFLKRHYSLYHIGNIIASTFFMNGTYSLKTE